MIGLLTIAAAMAIPAGSAAEVARTLESEVLKSGLAAMWYEAFVAPDGTVESCTVRQALGDAAAARAACAGIVGMRVTPAVGPDGNPSYGTLIGALNLADNIDRLQQTGLPADMTIEARGLPGDKPARIALTVAVAANGAVTACEGAGQLGQVACAQLGADLLPVRKSRAGAAVSYLRPLTVQFEPDRG